MSTPLQLRRKNAVPQIVVATDLKATAETAVARASLFGRSMNADLRLLHVLPEFLPAIIAEPRRLAARRALLDCAHRLGRETGRRVSYNLVHGDTPRWIARESENLDATLTVIGYGAKRRRRLLGTTAERSVRLTRNAVLIVRSRPSDEGEPYRKALIAPDSGTDEKTLMPYLRHLAPQAALHRFDLPGPSGCRQVNRAAAEHVAAMRRALDADFLVIGMPRDDTPNPFRFRRLLTPLVRAPECDTLIVPQGCAMPLVEPPALVRIRAAS